MANKTRKLIVSDIKKTLFVIPFYQRGYRWTSKNVKQLLSDLLSFDNSNEDIEYCLQPIVLQHISKDKYKDILKERGEESVIRVVDGQQRLTTIAIILRELKINTSWDIYYDTEKKRLSKIMEEDGQTSINDHFRKEVREAINDWLKKQIKLGIDIRQKLSKLFEGSDKKIAFLEYDVENSDNAESNKEGHKTFLRLNDGKTPLTASELIKALYMVRNNGLSIQQQMEISKEWEIIENTLRDNLFWLMFNAQGLEDTPTRIDLLFALVLEVDLLETKANPRIIFDKLEDEEIRYDLEKVWDEVLHTFWWMQSCYSDVELCNFLSWIRAYTDISAKTIYELWREYPVQKDFKTRIINKIQYTKFGGVHINSLDCVDYSWDKRELRKLFVLLNILGCNKSHERFRFDLFNKTKGWDIEHIDSQKPNEFKDPKNKREWIQAAWNELTKEQQDHFLKTFNLKVKEEKREIESIDLDKFDQMADCILELIRDTGDRIPTDKTNKLGNLALLNLSINRSYKNDIFPLKRKAIINSINNGTEYIPPCTVKAFSKFYTESASKITSWQISDYEGYYKVMNGWFEEFMNDKDIISNSKNKFEKTSLTKDSTEIEQEQVQNIELQEKHPQRIEEPVTFSQFMDTYDVVIPKIQRLYVQGRLDKRGKKCLTGFASNLVESASGHSPMLLDFVYGIDKSDGGKNIFYPLDGQQRFTTLLLLSWLCGLSKPNWIFRYESRRATEVFIKELLKNQPPQLIKPENYDELKEKAEKQNKNYPSFCKEYICNFPGFHESWLRDAGICGMIEMLDSLYDKLLNTPTKSSFSMDSIVFLVNYLDVSKKSYDHIFLKMNSRGRELSEWDNLNAILDEFIPTSFKEIWPERIQSWYEKMWNKISSKGKIYTDIITRVDSRMLKVVELALISVGYSGKSTNTFELSNWLKDSDMTEKFYGLCFDFFSALEIEDNADLPALIPNWTISHNPRIPDFAYEESEVVSKFYQPLLAFYASKRSTDKEWMRVIWNLIENSDVSLISFHQAVHLIDELAENLVKNQGKILSYLSNTSIGDIKKCYEKAKHQLQEEIDKAKQIVADNNSPKDWDVAKQGEWIGWHNVIIAAESKRYFAGAIRFLYHDGNNNINWSNFCTKWVHADNYFDDTGIKDEHAASLISALLKRCTKWDQIHDQFIFNKEDWKWPVLLNRLYIEPLNYILSNATLNVNIADFEKGLVCERLIRDRLFENNLINIITSKEYCRYRISSGRYFYGWRKHDGILLDWKTGKDIPESWERRRNMQVQSMLSASKDLNVTNTHVSGEIYYGYTLKLKYKNKYYFEWSSDNKILYKENDQTIAFLTVQPEMSGDAILKEMDLLLQSRLA